MKLQFDASLDYQIDAVNAVVELFDGQPLVQSGFGIETIHSKPMTFAEMPALSQVPALNAEIQGGMMLSALGVSNYLALGNDRLLENLHCVQDRNNIEKIEALQGRNFSVEMETGTGKTYVYLRTIFEMNRKYGFKKFIVVVPSIAVREGVLKSIEMTRAHFQALYDNLPFDPFPYDSKRLNKVSQFAGSNQLQIMIINIQSFQKDMPDKDVSELNEEELKKLNIIHRELDRMQGRKPIEFLQATNPIVIIDEPQSVDNTPKAKRAIASLNPAVTLRYSATHREAYNLVYRLDPVQAYDRKLVKRIEVDSVRADDSFNGGYVKLLKTDNKNGIKAQIEFHQEGSNGPKITKAWVKKNDDLYGKSGEREAYAKGYIVENIDCTPGAEYITFNQGLFLELGKEAGGLGDEVMKVQVRKTVENHLHKERVLKGRGIKVLSLFFIDRVANYRIYKEDGSIGLGKIGQWFEEAYAELSAKPIFKDLIPFPVQQIHNGYFSQDNKGRAKDTTGRGEADEDAYALIMRDKERLLDPNEPLRFIFSHSALREGWDNPNVFQICTLNETQSTDRKRQEIGRGLRLPVNDKGERIHDENINRLTIIANESYEDFARKLQSEFEEEFGIRFGRIEKVDFSNITRDDEQPIGQEESKRIWASLIENNYIDLSGQILDSFDPKRPGFELKIAEDFADIRPAIIDEMNKRLFKNRVVNARERKAVRFRKEVQLSPYFQELWQRISQRTRYRVKFDTAMVIADAAKRIKALPPIEKVRITSTRVELAIDEAGISADKRLEERSFDVTPVNVLPDLLGFLQKETELTRHTLVEILKQSGRIGDFKTNPQAFMTQASAEITRTLHDLMLEGIQYEKMDGKFWAMSLFEDGAEKDLTRYLSNLYEVQNQDKSLYDYVEYESEIERQFAKDLDDNIHVKLFVKLPRQFKIDTPIGPYNPDWAFVTEREEKLYFVRETKSSLNDHELRTKESQKIKCGRRHFDTLGVDYDVVTALKKVKF